MARWIFVTLILASMALVAWPAGRAAALIDISGQWSFTLLHPDVTGPLACSATVNQNSGNLSVPMSCDLLGSGTLTGTIDTGTGTFNLSGTLGVNPVTFAGQSAPDGNSASGMWVATGIPANGTFTGNRTLAGAGVGGLTELADVSAAAPNNADVSPGDEAPVLAYTLIGVGLLAAIGAAAAVRRRFA